MIWFQFSVCLQSVRSYFCQFTTQSLTYGVAFTGLYFSTSSWISLLTTLCRDEKESNQFLNHSTEQLILSFQSQSNTTEAAVFSVLLVDSDKD